MFITRLGGFDILVYQRRACVNRPRKTLVPPLHPSDNAFWLLVGSRSLHRIVLVHTCGPSSVGQEFTAVGPINVKTDEAQAYLHLHSTQGLA